MSLQEEPTSIHETPARPTRSMPQLLAWSPYQGIASSSEEAAANEATNRTRNAGLTPPPLRTTKTGTGGSTTPRPLSYADSSRPVSVAVTDGLSDIPCRSVNVRHGPVVSQVSSRHNSVVIDTVLAQDRDDERPMARPATYSPKRGEESVRLLSSSSPSSSPAATNKHHQRSQKSEDEKANSRCSGDLEIGLHKSVMDWRAVNPSQNYYNLGVQRAGSNAPTIAEVPAPGPLRPATGSEDEFDGFPRPLSPHLPLNISVPRETMFVGAVVMAQFMALAGLGQAISPMNVIGTGLEATNPGEQAWFAASYSLTVGTFILISGRMGDIIGHKRMFVFGYFFLGVWSGFAGFSAFLGRQIYFDICRAFQGLGAALLAPNALALLGRAYPPGLEKNLVFSLFGAMAPWGFVVGALYGAVFAEYIWWPWIFWSYGIAAWALAAFSTAVVPEELSYKAQFKNGRPRPAMDWAGCALGVTGLVLINVGWNNGPMLGWDEAEVYVVVAAGVAAILAFIWVESKAKSPILPICAMNATSAFTMALVSLGWAAFGVWIFYSWRFLEQLRGLRPIFIVAEFTPALVVGLLAAGATGAMLTNTPVSFTMMISMCAFFAGCAIATFQPVDQTYWAQMFVSILIMPFGMDMSFPAATVILSNHMPREHQGLAASLVNTFVNYSISLGLGVAATVEARFNNGGKTPADIERGIRVAYYTSLGMSGCGVILGALFFVRSMIKEGWKVMDH